MIPEEQERPHVSWPKSKEHSERTIYWLGWLFIIFACIAWFLELV